MLFVKVCKSFARKRKLCVREYFVCFEINVYVKKKKKNQGVLFAFDRSSSSSIIYEHVNSLPPPLPVAVACSLHLRIRVALPPLSSPSHLTRIMFKARLHRA